MGDARTTSEKSGRVATAVGFLAGLLACLNAVRDRRILWPPDVVWKALRHPQRLELGDGLALIVVTLVMTIVRQNTARGHRNNDSSSI